MTDDAKNDRRTARLKFTRKRTDFLRCVRDRKSLETIEDSYKQLTNAWNQLEDKHDNYTKYLKDDEIDDAEKWISELQSLFTDATDLKFEYIANVKKEDAKARAQACHVETIRKEEEEQRRTMERALIRRNIASSVFEAIYNNAIQAMEEDQLPTAFMKKLQSQLEDAIFDCRQNHEKYLELLAIEEAERETRWISNIQRRSGEIFVKLETQISANENKRDEETIQCNSIIGRTANMRLEKIKMPHFEGALREYPRFKKDFQKQAMPGLTQDTAPYALRSCLGCEPLRQVKSIDDDIDEMWERLDEKYGDPAKVTDTIINEIKQFKQLNNGEYKAFIDFVNTIEDGYRDLRRLRLEKEITTTSSVSIIEKKLPPEIKKEWARRVTSDKDSIDISNKFPALMKFLLSQKRAIEYNTADVRMTPKEFIHQSTNNEMEKTTFSSKCIFHVNANHLTSECRFYLSKPAKERTQLVIEKGGCWSCLKYGHHFDQCPFTKECGINGCIAKHHTSLHDDGANQSRELSGRPPED